MADQHKPMIGLANIYWESLDIHSLDKFIDWQDRHYTPSDELKKVGVGERRKPEEENRLALHGLSVSFRAFYDIVDQHVGKELRLLHEQPAMGDQCVRESYVAMSALMPMGLWLPDALMHAFNPTGRPEYMAEAREATIGALDALMTQTKDLKLRDADDYAQFALEVLTPYLPKEYVKLLQFEYEKHRTAVPQTEVQQQGIDLSTDRLLKRIAKGPQGPAA